MADQEFKLSYSESKALLDVLDFGMQIVNSEHAQDCFELSNLIRIQLDGKDVEVARDSIKEWNNEHGSLRQYRAKQKELEEAKQTIEQPPRPWWKVWGSTYGR